MSRRPNPIPSVQLNVALPLDVHTRLSAHLSSELEQRVPFGAYQRFLVELIRERFDGKSLDLAPFLEGVPADTFRVSGTTEAILALKYKLMEASNG